MVPFNDMKQYRKKRKEQKVEYGGSVKGTAGHYPIPGVSGLPRKVPS
jgi:hypothetical protein